MVQPFTKLSEGDVGPIALLPGDPGRVIRIAALMDDWREVAYNRAFHTIAGEYRGVRLTVTSTGLGGPACAVVIPELAELGAKAFIRVGSARTLHEEISVGEVVVAKSSYCSDGTSRTYGGRRFVGSDSYLLDAVLAASVKSEIPLRIVKNASHDAIYRAFRPKKPLGVQTTDLETSSVYAIARSLGARAVSILGVVCGQGDANEIVRRYTMESEKIIKMEESEIRLALEAACLLT